MLPGIRRENRRHAQEFIPQTQSLRDPFVVSVDRVAESVGVVGNYGVSEFVVVQDRTASGRPVDNVDTIGTAIVDIHRLLDLLITSERDGGNLPPVKTDHGAR